MVLSALLSCSANVCRLPTRRAIGRLNAAVTPAGLEALETYFGKQIDLCGFSRKAARWRSMLGQLGEKGRNRHQ